MPLSINTVPDPALRAPGSAGLARARLRRALARDRGAIPVPSAAEVLARLLDEPLPSLVEQAPPIAPARGSSQ
ncbi:MAG: hypothetical protein RMK84_18370 [Oscillochloridaceae bacterium]|nr:hypothetical protein [Chloroflexaceae bacterium]MDW8392091.1 hypothetical protein [Oscillochloridaceae bacterium]